MCLWSTTCVVLGFFCLIKASDTQPQPSLRPCCHNSWQHCQHLFGKLHKSQDAGLLGKSEQEHIDGAQNKHSCHSALAMLWATWRIVRGLCFSWSRWWKYSELLDGLEKSGMCKMESRFKKTMYFMSRSGSKTADCLFQPGFYMWS